ncbi:MAG: Rho termination factor N-terminal domain-containing protein, partial [Mycobacteriaceae bacterium]
MTETDLITAQDRTPQSETTAAVTSDSSTSSAGSDSSAGSSLATMVLPELRALANSVGVKGTSGMRKNDLISAIRETQNGSGGGPSTTTGTTTTTTDEAPRATVESTGAPRADTDAAAPAANRDESKANNRNDNRADNNRNDNRADNNRADNRESNDSGGETGGPNNRDDDGDGRGGRRGRRFRDRRRRGERAPGEGGGNGEAELREDDVVQPVAGILDVLDNYAFVRTSGYLAGPNDVYVSMNMVRKNGLRRGDAVTGAVRVAKETGDQSNQRQKFNPLVRLDTVNGGPVEDARKRPEFGKLTPLYPNQRLRLETTPEKLTTRVIDLIMPIGKGQRALIVSPPKAGKTTIMQD